MRTYASYMCVLNCKPSMEAILEEIEALKAIYSDEVEVDARTASDADGNPVSRVEVTFKRKDPVVARLDCPDSYPTDSPFLSVDGLDRAVRSRIMKEASKIMDSLAGSPVLYLLVEAVRSGMDEDRPPEGSPAERDVDDAAAPLESARSASVPEAAHCGVDIYTGPALTVAKSVFIAHVARVTSEAQVSSVLQQLLANPKISRATHPIIRAFRFTDPSTGRRHADNDDDGEDAAGGRLAHLLELLGADDCIVVVTRWFGGVLLGPQRFKHINEVARLAVEAQPWYKGRSVGGSASAGSASGGAGAGSGTSAGKR